MATREHGFELSVDNGDTVSAVDAFRHFTGQGKQSAGVLAVTKAECGERPVRPDPVDDWPHHILVGFQAMSHKERRDAAKALLMAAMDRGWLYGPFPAISAAGPTPHSAP